MEFFDGFLELGRMEMKRSFVGTALVAAISLCTASAALAQAKPQARVDFGELEYRSSCAVCHGVTGKGKGEFDPYLSKRATDLTTLAKANGGVFPLQRVYDVIDGRQTIPSHGTRDMPIWGLRYSVEAGSQLRYAEVPGPYDAEALVRARILALVEYINRLQVR
jgi:mono/diheme cytochrome c family protein